MKITLDVGLGGFVRLDRTEATIPDKVVIRVVPKFKTEHLVLTAKCPYSSRQYNADTECDISDLCKMEGTVQMKLAQYEGGTKLCEWQVEPLILRKADEDIEPIPAIIEMQERLTEAEKTALTLKEAVKELYKLIKE